MNSHWIQKFQKGNKVKANISFLGKCLVSLDTLIYFGYLHWPPSKNMTILSYRMDILAYEVSYENGTYYFVEEKLELDE